MVNERAKIRMLDRFYQFTPRSGQRKIRFMTTRLNYWSMAMTSLYIY